MLIDSQLVVGCIADNARQLTLGFVDDRGPSLRIVTRAIGPHLRVHLALAINAGDVTCTNTRRIGSRSFLGG